MSQQADSNLPPAGWFGDPEGKHQYRYWDGGAWTDYVADNGQQSLAPLAAQTDPVAELKRRQADIEAELIQVEEKISRAANSSNDAALGNILIADFEERLRGGGGTGAESPILRRTALQEELESIQRQLTEADQEVDEPAFVTVGGILSAAEAVDVLFERALPATPDATAEDAHRTYEFVRASWGSEALYSGTPAEMKQLILRNLERMQAEDGFESFRVEVNTDENHLRAMVVVFSGGAFQPVGVYRSADMVLVCGNAAFVGPSQ